jgi:hypothetical protein
MACNFLEHCQDDNKPIAPEFILRAVDSVVYRNMVEHAYSMEMTRSGERVNNPNLKLVSAVTRD